MPDFEFPMLCCFGIWWININIVVHILRRINVLRYNDFLVVEFFYCFTVIDWTTDMLSTTVYDRGGETRSSRVYAMKSRLINYRLGRGGPWRRWRNEHAPFLPPRLPSSPPRTTFGSLVLPLRPLSAVALQPTVVWFVLLSVSTITPITHRSRRVSQMRTETVRNSCAWRANTHT